MRYTIQTNYPNRKEYYLCNSLWAANLIAAKFKKNIDAESVFVVDNETFEILTILED